MRYLVSLVLCMSSYIATAQNVACGGLYGSVEHDGGGAQNQMAFNELQQMSGWGTCDNQGCSDGTGGGTCWIEPYQTQPSLSGSSTEIFDYTASDFALFYKKLATSTQNSFDTKYNNVNQLTFDYWFKVDSNALTNGLAFEFDSFQFYFYNGGGGNNTCDCTMQNGHCVFNGPNYCYRYMAGMQCDSQNPMVPHGDWGWDFFDSLNGTWHNGYQDIQCQGLLDGNWHHVQSVVQLSHAAGSLSYQFTSLKFDGVSQTLGSNTTFEPAITDDFPNLGIQFQIDLNSSGASGIHEWFDNATLDVTYSQ